MKQLKLNSLVKFILRSLKLSLYLITINIQMNFIKLLQKNSIAEYLLVC